MHCSAISTDRSPTCSKLTKLCCRPAGAVEIRDASIGVRAVRNPGLNRCFGESNVISATACRPCISARLLPDKDTRRPANGSADLQARIVQLIFGLTLAVIWFVTM